MYPPKLMLKFNTHYEILREWKLNPTMGFEDAASGK
jgi:hypothetical protein